MHKGTVHMGTEEQRRKHPTNPTAETRKKTITRSRDDGKQQNARGEITATANLNTEKAKNKKGLKEHNIRSSQNRPHHQQRRAKGAANTRTIGKHQKRPEGSAEPVGAQTRRTTGKRKSLMRKYTQKQRTDTERCIRSRPQQQKEEDHIPDILERQIEGWMDQEGITIEDIRQTYRDKNQQGGKKTKHSSLEKLSKQMDKWHKPEDKDNQENHTAAVVMGEERRGNSYEKDQNSNKNLEK